jgi:hypothetical protein
MVQVLEFTQVQYDLVLAEARRTLMSCVHV